MWLLELEADRLRNLQAVSLSLNGGLTLVAGRNGQGKTSLLEAVYLLGTGRSFRTRRLEDLLCWDGGPLRVAGRVAGLRGESRLLVIQHEGERRMSVGGAETDLEGFIGRLDVVDLNSERMKVIRGGPDERRRFLDRGIVGLEPGYLRVLGEYRRVLQQRNALLRSGAPRSRAELDAWDERLVPAAFEVHRRRREYAGRLSAELGEPARLLLAGRIGIHYRPSPEEAGKGGVEAFRQVFRQALGRGRERDRMLRHTCRGPHRDDLLVELENVDLRRFGSAGQVRAAMIALKLAKLAMLRKDRGEAPLFLMDDFDSDLDEARAATLAGHLHEGGFQALVATSKEEMATRLGVPFARVRMDGGRARAS